MFKKINKNTAIKQMNKLGKSKTPFLFIIDFEFTKAIIITNEELHNNKIKFSFNNFTNFTEKATNKSFSFEKFPVSLSEYETAFYKVQKEIKNGNTYLLNLSFKTKINTNQTLSGIYKNSKSAYKLYIKDKFVVFSPEIFVKIKDNIISSYPMKGTIDASIPNAENIILKDKKETAEHYTIVDLIRNDLNIVAKKIEVKKFRYIDEISTNGKNLLQVSSEISGTLPLDWNEQLGTIFGKLLPAGSISGAPKKKTVEIIKSVESYNRDFYTGIAGYYDGKSIDSFVMIRFIENENNQFIFKSGGGITSMSDAKNEYQEMIDKVYIPI